MKKWNEAEIVELNIAETAGFLDGLKDFTDHINPGDGIQDLEAVVNSGVYAAEETLGIDMNGDGIIGRPTNSGSNTGSNTDILS